MNIRTSTDNRKALVNAISEYLGEKKQYFGPPTFAYKVGDFTIDCAGTITYENEEEGEALREYLIEQGFLEQEIQSVEVNIPIEGMGILGLKNLVFLLHSKQYLLNRVVRCENFYVSEALIEELEKNTPGTAEAFITTCGEAETSIKGMKITEEHVTFYFPFSEDQAKNKALIELAALMVASAKGAKRVNPKEQKPDNEKYYLRIWLVRLGLEGEAGKEPRKALLKGLKGHTAFKTSEDEEKHKARILAKKAIKNT